MVSTHPGLEEPIAVIGSACRFPGGSSSPSKLWELLQEPRDVVRNFDPKRFNLERFYHPDGETHGSTDVKPKSYLLEEDSRVFDAAFFSSSPVDAASMDPQQRQLLEVTYEAFESAGVPLEKIRGSLTSVHVGVMTNDYAVIQARDTETLPKYNATGSANSILSNRVSYVFDLKGPSVTLDTACSSSLVALHHAVQGLRNGDSELAIVGGTNLIFEPTPYIAESKLHMLSPDSQSRMWDKTANGYARGEGIAALLLKPLSRALRDGDSIEGVIRATGVNSDGQSPGITMPFAPAQAALIRQTYRRAGLDPMRDPPQYFECHGTGTQAGDPVEARAVYEAFYRDGKSGEAKVEPQTIHVGSIKTIIGHLEGCAGLAGSWSFSLLLASAIVRLPLVRTNSVSRRYQGPSLLEAQDNTTQHAFPRAQPEDCPILWAGGSADPNIPAAMASAASRQPDASQRQQLWFRRHQCPRNHRESAAAASSCAGSGRARRRRRPTAVLGKLGIITAAKRSEAPGPPAEKC
jgi:acyl transferase domain-containing protein